MFTTITSHWTEILAAIAAIHTGALIIVNITKTPKDDEALSFVYRIIEIIAGVVTKLVKK